MGAFVIYILEWSACLLGFLLLYKMCFSGTTFHRFNRFYLLVSLALSAILPLIHIAPTEQMEPIAESCRAAVWVDENPLTTVSVSSALSSNTESLTILEKGAIILLAAYVLYVLTQFVGWTKSMLKTVRFLHGKRRHRIGSRVWLVEHDGEYGPFSWMNRIVISAHEQGFGRRATMRHELSHIVLLHHLDLVLIMLCIIINPTCWLVMKEIKVVHEYEADDEVINHYRIRSRDYQRLLIMRTVGAEAYALASSFNLNIKKRIMMMKKKQSNWWRMTWIAVTLPLIGFSLMAFSKPKEALKDAVDNSIRIIEQPLVDALTSDVPTESVIMVEEAPVSVPEDVSQPSLPDVKPGDIVTGSVKNENGQPLQNAILVEIDQFGRIVAQALTDKNGNFSLKVVSPENKIRISYVGYKSNTLDISNNKIDATLERNATISSISVHTQPLSIDANALNTPYFKDDILPSDDDQVFDVVQEMPRYPGGDHKIFEYLAANLRYPTVAREMQVDGEVIVEFTVGKTGLISSPKVVEVNTKSPLLTAEIVKDAKDGKEEAVEISKNYYDAIEALKEEAIHVVRNMPRWEPGRQNGKRIETTYTLPISFKMQ